MSNSSMMQFGVAVSALPVYKSLVVVVLVLFNLQIQSIESVSSLGWIQW